MNMESHFQGAFPDGEWDFSRMFSTEDHHHHHQIDFSNCDQFLFPGENEGGLEINFPLNPELTNVNQSLFYSWNGVSQENSSSSNCSSSFFAPDQSYFFSDSMSMDFCIVDEKNSNSFVPVFPEISMAKAVSINENINNNIPAQDLQLKRKIDIPESEVNAKKKKTRVTKSNKKNVKVKNNQELSPKSKEGEEEERNGGEERQSSSSCSSEEESEALNSSGKARASRGSATDPQSLYARKRRERINERLRILQNLVPNGTKVDISTMLEEAVQYVKFLQLQIKLLSSDDLWMYAPIAYNGMDIGLNQKISMLL